MLRVHLTQFSPSLTNVSLNLGIMHFHDLFSFFFLSNNQQNQSHAPWSPKGDGSFLLGETRAVGYKSHGQIVFVANRTRQSLFTLFLGLSLDWFHSTFESLHNLRVLLVSLSRWRSIPTKGIEYLRRSLGINQSPFGTSIPSHLPFSNVTQLTSPSFLLYPAGWGKCHGHPKVV